MHICRLQTEVEGACRPARVCILVFSNPQHAARRAMAAACRCPRRQQRFFQRKPTPSPTHWESNRGTPFSSPTKPPRLTKETSANTEGPVQS